MEPRSLSMEEDILPSLKSLGLGDRMVSKRRYMRIYETKERDTRLARGKGAAKSKTPMCYAR